MEKHSATHTLDLQFFGAVGAPISHEMKNVLAILNESAGLLGDFSRMAATGRRSRISLASSSLTEGLMKT